MATATAKQPEYGTRLQIWPGGKGLEYYGDLDGPAKQRMLRDVNYNGGERQPWRKGTPDEWRQLKIESLAEMYAERDILCCDSSLIDDLIKQSGETHGDVANAFSYEEIQGLYADPSEWDAEACRDYASEHGLELPDCDPCPEHETHEAACEGCAEMYEDESRHGWLTEAREVCRDYAQDNPAEVYEWWRVTGWLCNQLKAVGEVTIDNGYGHWWGRCCTGQGLIMDGVLQRIAASFVSE